MKLRFLVALLLLPFSPMAKADLCADPVTHAYATCANAPDYTTGVTLYDKTSIKSPNSLSLMFDAVSYGAKCDGTTEDSIAFQAATTAMSTTGGTLLIPAGRTCIVGDVITLPSHSHVTGAGATLTAKTSGFPWSTNAITFTNATNATDITIEGLNFVYPASASGATHIIQLTSTASNVKILNNTSNYGGDVVASIGATDVKIVGNTFKNCANACIDSWNNAGDLIITGNNMTVLGASARGVEITGQTTGATASITTQVAVTENIIKLLGSAEQAINVDGLAAGCSAGAAEVSFATIADNTITMAPGLAGWAILSRFCPRVLDIHDNLIKSDGTDMTSTAVSAATPGTNVKIHDNQVDLWNNSSVGAERGAFRNTTVGGSLAFNECSNCTIVGSAATATNIVGATDATTKVIGNGIGAGPVDMGATQQLDWLGGGILTSPSAARVQLGAADAASPVAQTLGTQGSRQGTDTDVAGANLAIVAGRGTGSATGSTMIFYTPAATSTGSTAQTQTPRITLGDNIVDLGVASTVIRFNGVVYGKITAPTIASGFNTGGSVAGANTFAFQITVGASTGTTSGVLTMPAAPTGWSCSVADVTTPATNMVQQTAYTTTAVTVTNYVRTTGVAGNFTNSDKLNFVCGAF